MDKTKNRTYKYAGIMLNDVGNGPGVRVSIFTQGCPHHCLGCFNPQTWDFNGGYDFTDETLQKIIQGIAANGIQRNLSILGGEPLCPQNREFVLYLLKEIKKVYPKINVFLWTGYTYKELQQEKDETLKAILSFVNTLIDGPFIKEQRDITLLWRGSRNQQIIVLNPNF